MILYEGPGRSFTSVRIDSFRFSSAGDDPVFLGKPAEQALASNAIPRSEGDFHSWAILVT
jgi:hypothetical protein